MSEDPGQVAGAFWGQLARTFWGRPGTFPGWYPVRSRVAPGVREGPPGVSEDPGQVAGAFWGQLARTFWGCPGRSRGGFRYGLGSLRGPGKARRVRRAAAGGAGQTRGTARTRDSSGGSER
ncbi:hypothetical protein TPA0910_54100 [Streptomyces hygroscopicus subsp. sporocinereus]|uniref:Uncharacterized protein n=1 Tax=Streptomyces hygroscopicus TaxID=1912 RepID=A0ABQ3U5U8_STRHY|nr:hypothetical protein TPA0910_54100 [Streptomyces hygroscopicus]